MKPAFIWVKDLTCIFSPAARNTIAGMSPLTSMFYIHSIQVPFTSGAGENLYAVKWLDERTNFGFSGYWECVVEVKA